jgi:tetratricopeptide (TPR) repeat protein
MGHHDLAEEHFKKYVDLDNTANSFSSLACGYRFAGRYTESIDALNEGIARDTELFYLYEELAMSYLLQGCLKNAETTLEKYLEVAKREPSVARARFYFAYLEFLKGDMDKAIKELNPVIEFYSNERYSSLIDDLTNQPLWLLGLIAIQNKDLERLDDVLTKMEKKIVENRVNATNYFRIYKFHVHLKMLEALLRNDEIEVLRYIVEGKRIQKKMGYWYSMFDMAFFFDEYAKILIELKKWDEAHELLNSVVAYNPNYASSLLKLAKIHLNNNDLDEARAHYRRAIEFLDQADVNYFLVDEARELGTKLNSK